jgi:HTH-type transcriptional regulator / antitoxin HigA
MTTGLKTPSSYYIELINAFPPRPITNDAELTATQIRINALLDQKNLTQDDRDYLKVLGTLIFDYEEKHEPMPTLSGVALVKALMEDSNLQPSDLIPIFASEEAVVEVLNCEKQLTEHQLHALAEFFHISADSLK